MADRGRGQAGQRGGRARGAAGDRGASRGGARGDRGDRGGRRGRGRGRRGRRRGDGENEEVWHPVTKLGRLVSAGKIKSLEEIYLHSLPVKEYQIIDHFLKKKLKDEVMKIKPVQKQTRAGQRTRFKAFVVVGDEDGHLGLGVKTSKEVATAIRGAIILAKLAVIPVRRGYYANKIGEPHTIPTKISGKCGSVSIRLIPAPKGTGLVAAPAPRKLLHLSGIGDVYTASTGHTKTMGNFVKATFIAISNLYNFLTPDLWFDRPLIKNPFQEHTDFLASSKVVFEKAAKELKEDEDV